MSLMLPSMCKARTFLLWICSFCWISPPWAYVRGAWAPWCECEQFQGSQDSLDADVNVTFCSLTDSFNLIAAVYESAIQSNLHYILRVGRALLASACPYLLLIQETWVTSFTQILHLEPKRSRGGIQPYNSMELLIESVTALCLLFLWVTLQHAMECRFPITPQMVHWKCSRAAGDAHDDLQQLELLYWEAWEVFKALCVQTKAVYVRRRERQQSEQKHLFQAYSVTATL